MSFGQYLYAALAIALAAVVLYFTSLVPALTTLVVCMLLWAIAWVADGKHEDLYKLWALRAAGIGAAAGLVLAVILPIALAETPLLVFLGALVGLGGFVALFRWAQSVNEQGGGNICSDPPPSSF